jgi:hypothetical protein
MGFARRLRPRRVPFCAVAACTLAALAGCGPCGDDERAAVPPPATPAAPTPTASAAAPSPTPTPTATAEAARVTGDLAVGLTEMNPNLVWPERARDVHPEFARWRDAIAALKPSYYRLVLDWPSLEPRSGRPAFDAPNAGCMREVGPCGNYSGLRDQLRALASRQRGGGWETLVVIAGTPEWAARPAGGCERKSATGRNRPPRTGDGMQAYGRFVRRVLDEARAQGAELRYWSPWNEPNHPYFISPQRQVCDAGAESAAVPAYVELARALKSALDAAPGEQELVLGELAGLDERRPMTTSVAEFVAGIPDDLVCASRIWSQHGYVGGRDPVDDLERALRRKGCERPAIWITETGVGAPRSGDERRTSPAAQRRACKRLHRRLRRWYEDERVTAAFQYTFREDDRFPTGLVKTDLSEAYPALAEWTAWGSAQRPRPTDPPPPDSCG